jgi:FtsZ-binding cell division protein ZapB|tara:strand:+ start:4807 stop:4980 length:174 start_codon:yes stop_codon:yes gene_type:complete
MVYHTMEDRIEVIEMEIKFLEEKYEKMDSDGGRFQTAIEVLKEIVDELKFKCSWRRH